MKKLSIILAITFASTVAHAACWKAVNSYGASIGCFSSYDDCVKSTSGRHDGPWTCVYK